MRSIPHGSLALAFVIGLLAGVASSARAEDAPLVPVGTARIDITPDYAVRLAGYGARKTESQGVADRIFAKAVAIGSDGEPGPALLMNVENCGLRETVWRHVSEKLAPLGVRPERLVIGSTHTHAAPQLKDWAPYIFSSDVPPEHQERIDRYTRELADKLVEVARQALAARRPARLGWTQGKVAFAANRRVLKDGRWTGFGVAEEGPVDHSLPILAARDESGKLVAVVANYACHCTTLGPMFNHVSGDWAGMAQQDIEADHPGAVALVVIGCGADANPHPRGSVELARQHARSLADETKRLLAGRLAPLSPPLDCRQETIDLPFEKPRTRQEWEERAKAPGAVGYHAQQFLARIERNEPIPAALSYTVTAWNFGHDLAMVFLPGEVVVDYAVRLKTELDGDRLWITAYANYVPCYIPSKRVLREGGYEADTSMLFYARPHALAPECEDLIVKSARRLVPGTFASKQKEP